MLYQVTTICGTSEDQFQFYLSVKRGNSYYLTYIGNKSYVSSICWCKGRNLYNCIGDIIRG